MASPVLRDTIRKLKSRRALLRRQVKGPLQELAQIEDDLRALGAGTESRPARRATGAARAPRGANQAAVLRAIRDGATTPEEIAGRTGLPAPTVSRTLAAALRTQKLVTTGLNGLTLTRTGRDRLRELEDR